MTGSDHSASPAVSAATRPVIAPLQGLRALAALTVLGAALNFHVPLTSSEFVAGGVRGASDIAMTLFFVLSGFAIWYRHGAELAAMPATSALWHHVAERTARLYPLYALALALAVLVAPAGAVFGAMPDVLLLPLAAQDWLAGKGTNLALNALDPFSHAWTVSALALAGLIVPITARWVGGLKSVWDMQWLLAILLLLHAATHAAVAFWSAPLMAIVAPDNLHGNVERWLLHYAPYPRILEVLSGCLLARIVLAARKWPRSGREPLSATIAPLVGLLLILLAVYSYADEMPEHWRLGILSVRPLLTLWAAILLIGTISVHDRGWTARALSWRPLVAIGGVSYALYLLHPFVLRAIPAVPPQETDGIDALARGAAVVAITALCLLVAWAATRWMERPLRTLIAGLAGKLRAGEGMLFVGLWLVLIGMIAILA